MNAKTHLVENVSYLVRGADGKTKKIFQTWGWVGKLIKSGRISPLHPKLSGIFGYWTNEMRVANLITNAGATAVASQIGGMVTYPVFKYIAVGTGTVTATATAVALTAEITDSGLARGTATMSQVTTDVTNDTAQGVLSFSVTGSKAVTESGFFNHLTVAQGTMLAYQIFSAINVVNGDTLQITWKIDVD
jgi:hypothetical protein